MTESQRNVEYKTHNGKLYDFNNCIYVGVLIKENVVKKISKLQAKYLEDAKKILFYEAERGNVFPSMWTLHYPNGKQTKVTYVDTSENVENKIKMATMANRPRFEPLVFIASSMEEAKSMADARYNDLGGPQ